MTPRAPGRWRLAPCWSKARRWRFPMPSRKEPPLPQQFPQMPSWWDTMREIMRLELQPIKDKLDTMGGQLDNTYSKEVVDAKIGAVKDALDQHIDDQAQEGEHNLTRSSLIGAYAAAALAV